MRFLTRSLLFLFVLGLAGLFPYNSSVFAQTPPSASEVVQTDMRSVADFVERAKEALQTGDDFLAFRKEVKTEAWKSGSIYLIVVQDDLVILHTNDPEAEERDIKTPVPEVGMLLDALNNGGTQCIQYDDYQGVEDRYACAVAVSVPSIPGGPRLPGVLIGGLHHDKLPDEPLEDLLGGNYVPEVVASDVVDAETLKAFVDGAVEAIFRQFDVTPPPNNLGRFRPVLRREDGPWRHKDIYLFVRDENFEIIFNANDPSLEDSSRDLFDMNNCDIGEEFLRVMRSNGEDRRCKDLGLLPETPSAPGFFVEYLWDNPDDPNDDDLRFKEGGQEFLDLSPGITPKLSYIRSFPTPEFPDRPSYLIIVGAGVYPQADVETDERCPDDDGCAISSGYCNNPRNILFNLILVGFLLYGAVLWKGRLSSERQ